MILRWLFNIGWRLCHLGDERHKHGRHRRRHKHIRVPNPRKPARWG